MKTLYKSLLFTSIIFLLFSTSSCQQKEVFTACHNGKILLEENCVCPKNTFEKDGSCHKIKENMFFKVENECNCFESEIILLSLDLDVKGDTSIGRIILDNDVEYHLSSAFSDQDMIFIKNDHKKYTFESFPIFVYCNQTRLKYNWDLTVIDDNEIIVGVNYIDHEQQAINQSDCKMIFRKRLE